MDAHALALGAPGNRRARPRLSGLKDEGLARLAGNGSEWAFATLYERYHPPLYRYCRSIVRHEADAQDALQATFTSAYGALRTGRRDAPVRPWLFRIAHNESITVLRQRRAQHEIPEDVPAVGADVEAQATGRERLQQLVADLQALPDRQRSALIMRELSGLSHQEIAVALESSVAAAKQTIFEARRTLSEYEAGRAMSCGEVCRIVSDRDRRALRSRRVRAHVRSCAECAAFASALPARTADLRALAAPLPPAVAAGILSRATGGAASAGGGCGAAASGLGSKLALSAAGAKIAAGVAVVSATLGAAAVVGADRPAPRHGVTSAPAVRSVSFAGHPASGHGSTASRSLSPHYGAGRVGVPTERGAAGRDHFGKAGGTLSSAHTHRRHPAHAGAFSEPTRGNAYAVGHTGHGAGNGSAAPGQERSQSAANRANGGPVRGNRPPGSAPGRSGIAGGRSSSAPRRSIGPPGQGAITPGLAGASPHLAPIPPARGISAPKSAATAPRSPDSPAASPVRPNSSAASPRAGASSATAGQARKG